MSRKQLITGIAVAVALAVVAIFFIFSGPFNMGISLGGSGSQQPQNNLVVQDEQQGTGDVAQPGDMVTVDYTGKFQNGTVFDTSVGRAPFQFTLGGGQVIPGWDEGLVGMKVGGKRLLIIPPSLAYGAQGAGPIPPNSTLVFEVTLLKVQAPSNTAPAPEGPAAQ